MSFERSSSARRATAAALLALSLLALVLLASGAGATVPAVVFQTLDSDDGLSHNTVWDVLRDSRGFLWIGTEAELHRYDGQVFESYRHDPDDPASIASSEVMAIYEDRGGDLWFGTRNRGISRYDVALDRFERFPPSVEPGSPWLEHWVRTFLEDRRGTLWVGTSEGLYRLDEASELRLATVDPRMPPLLEKAFITSLFEDRQGALWIGTWENGLVRIEPSSGPAGNDGADLELEIVTRQNDPDDPSSLAQNAVTAIWDDVDGTVWVATDGGILHRADSAGGTFERIDVSTTCSQVESAARSADGVVWLASYGQGLCRFDPATGAAELHRHDPARDGALPSNRVVHVSFDDADILWVGTRGGLAKLDPRPRQFQALREKVKGIGGIRGTGVLSLAEAPDGSLWIGTGDGWLTRASPELRELGHVRPADAADDQALAEALAGRAINSLLVDRSGRLWLGSTAGLFELADTGRPLRYATPSDDPIMVVSMLEDPDGGLWIGTYSSGLFRYEPSSDTWSPPFESKSIHSLALDTRGRLWIGTTSGLGRLDPGAETIEFDRHDPDDPSSLGSDAALSVTVAGDGGVWVGTAGAGVQRLDPTTGRYRRYGVDHGLPHPNVTAVLEGRDPTSETAVLWVSTHRGLARFDPADETFRSFDQSDGLHGNVFLFGARLRTSDGRLLFGGQNGLTALDPGAAPEAAAPPPVYITGIRLDGEAVRPGTGSPLTQSILTTDRLTLDHRTKNVTFELSAPQFVPYGRSRYRYRLDGYDDEWVETRSSSRRAHYTNLDPGDYVFRSQAAVGDGPWGTREATLRLTVEPPPWRSGWALALYAALALAAIGGALHVQRRELDRERAVVQQLREVGRLKDEFLTKTSHELRTPLYGITGLAESLLDDAGQAIEDAHRRTLRTMVASGRRLSHLVNDILDFSQGREGRLTLQPRPVDPFAAVDVVLELTRPLVDGARVRLVNRVPRDAPRVLADENRLQQILHNLVGNAAKFTDEGRIEVGAERVSPDHLALSVRDTGPGIPEAEQERIFEAFEQVDDVLTRAAPGSGLGLAVTRQLVELHGGRLEVESQPGHGATFRFTLPIAEASAGGTDSPSTEEIVPAPSPIRGLPFAAPVEPLEALERSEAPDDRAPHILIVDDEPVNRLVLRNVLASAGYRLTEAAHGREALAAFDSDDVDPFDLVLLDVMMPRTSGYQVCRTLRESASPEELPIIFLTAKGGPDDVVTGMALGANDYLTKPIAKAELLARVRLHLQLAESHERLGQLVQEKMAQVKVLQGLLPICSYCKKIRDDEGYWSEVEIFIDSHSEAQFSHGLCPGCCDEHFGHVLDEVPSAAAD